MPRLATFATLAPRAQREHAVRRSCSGGHLRLLDGLTEQPAPDHSPTALLSQALLDAISVEREPVATTTPRLALRRWRLS